MYRLFLLLALTATVGVLGACDDDNPSGPSGGSATMYTFRANLTSGNEVPPVTNAEAGASGVMDITLNVTRDAAGAITGATSNFSGTLTGFPANTAITAAHIHTGVAGVNGGPVVNLALSPGDIVLANGGGAISRNNITVSADTANQLIANPAAFYFNAHTALNPGGAVRGQLARVN